MTEKISHKIRNTLLLVQLLLLGILLAVRIVSGVTSLVFALVAGMQGRTPPPSATGSARPPFLVTRP